MIMEAIKEKKQEVKMDIEAMTEVYAKLAIPGAPHKMLAKMEGSWITRSRMWMDPDKPPEESVGTSQNKMIYDGRFLQQEYTDTMRGNPVAGMVITGFDNNTKKYVTVSFGSMSSGMYLFEGTASADGKTITQENSYVEPIMGAMVYRAVTRFIDNNTYTFEMFGTDKNGKEMKMMESSYTRK